MDAHITDSIGNSYLFGAEKKHIVFTDCDGVLCDGAIYHDDGSISRKFNLRDGHGFSLLKENGFIPIILSGESDWCQTNRAEKLAVPFFGNVHDKLKMAQLIINGLPDPSIWTYSFIGDDVLDLPLLQASHFSASPHNAHNDVSDFLALNKRSLILNSDGGQGVFREFADLIINLYKIMANKESSVDEINELKLTYGYMVIDNILKSNIFI